MQFLPFLLLIPQGVTFGIITAAIAVIVVQALYIRKIKNKPSEPDPTPESILDDFVLEQEVSQTYTLTKAYESTCTELLENKERFRVISEQTLLGIALLQDNYIQYANQAMSDGIGYSVDDICSWEVSELLDLFHPEDKKFMLKQAMLKQQGATEGVVDSYNVRATSRSGKKLWLTLFSKTVTYMSRPADLIIMADITEHKLVEEQLRHSQKMDSVGQLAGGVAHDFNNMLGGIMGAADLLELKLKGNTEALDMVEMIKDATKRASSLTDQLLEFSRKEQAATVPFNFHTVIDKTLGIIERSIDKRIIISKELQARKTTVKGDAGLIQNAILNLALNARDAMPKGGLLTFCTENVTLKNSFHAVLEAGQYIKLTVEDNGCGMTTDVAERIFEPFFTTKNDTKGTGLGLASTYSTIKKHQGLIDVDTTFGEGATFTIYLPTVEAKLPAEDEKLTAVKGTATILVVDDEHVVRTVLKNLLESMGYTVMEAEDGLEALNIYKEHYKAIDLALIDIIMPKMDGAECFKEMCKVNPDIKAVALSGFTRDITMDELYNKGLKSFIRKPVDRIQLGKVISQALNS